MCFYFSCLCPLASKAREAILLCSALVRHHGQCCIQLRGPQHKKDMDLLEQVQKGLEQLSCEDKLRKLRLFSLVTRRLWGDLTAAFQYFKACKKAGERLFTRACSDRTRDNGFKLRERRCRSDTRKQFLVLRAVRPWHCCPEQLWVPHPWRWPRPGWALGSLICRR